MIVDPNYGPWDAEDAASLSAFLSGPTGRRLAGLLLTHLANQAIALSAQTTTETALHTAGRIAGSRWMLTALVGLANPAPVGIVPASGPRETGEQQSTDVDTAPAGDASDSYRELTQRLSP